MMELLSVKHNDVCKLCKCKALCKSLRKRLGGAYLTLPGLFKNINKKNVTQQNPDERLAP